MFLRNLTKARNVIPRRESDPNQAVLTERQELPKLITLG